MINYKKLAGANIAEIVPYKPGKPVKELEWKLGIKDCIKLASNENPLGCSSGALQAARDVLNEVSRYPLDDVYYLRRVMADYLDVPVEKFLFGAGSSELIVLILRTFVSESENVISPFPSFPIYELAAKGMGVEFRWIPVKEKSFKVNFKALLGSVDHNTRVIFLANPNNPTGEYIDRVALDNFIEKIPSDVIIVMDEAYVEYVDAPDYPNTLSMLDTYPNVFVMRTFPKAFGLAALRIGYLIADKEAVDMMNKLRMTFNVNMVAQAAAEAALKDIPHLRRVIQENSQGKVYLYRQLDGMRIRYVPTQANFILINVENSQDVFDNLLREGIIVRFLGKGMPDWIRVSIGTQEENRFFITKLKKVLSRGKYQ